MEHFASVCHLYRGNYYWCYDSGLSLFLEEDSTVLEMLQMTKKTSYYQEFEF